MKDFFKSIGKGILYILVLPVFLVALVLFAVIGIFFFLFMLVKAIILFFQGKKIDEPLPEDKEADRRLHQNVRQQPASEPVIVMERPQENQYIEVEEDPVPIQHREYQQIQEQPNPQIEQKEEPFIPLEEPPYDEEEDLYQEQEKEETPIPLEVEEEEIIEQSHENEEEEILPMEDDPNQRIFEEKNSFNDTDEIKIDEWGGK